MSRRSSRRKSHFRAGRKEKALRARESLFVLLKSPRGRPVEMVDSAAKQMWKLGTRHRIGLHPELRHWICRGCHRLLRPGLNATVRTRRGMRLTTCLDCGKLRRFKLLGDDAK